MDAGHALGVLGGQRGEHGRAVDAERRERLEVGLDAGAAARIRTGNGDGDGGLGGLPHCAHVPRLPMALSTMPRSSRAAACGSPLSESAEMTATPSAPAAMTSAALVASMPAMPHSGNSGSRRRKMPAICPKPAGPIGGLVLFLDEVANTPPTPTYSRSSIGAASACATVLIDSPMIESGPSSRRA